MVTVQAWFWCEKSYYALAAMSRANMLQVAPRGGLCVHYNKFDAFCNDRR